MRAESLIGLAAGTLAILGMFLVVSGAFTGIGLLLRRAFRVATDDIDNWFLAFWTGFGMVIFLLIIWNFLLPVGLTTFVVILSLGGLGWWFEGLPLRVFRRGAWRPTTLQALLLVVGALWVANHSMPGFQSWDDGLYHAQGVQWAETYPVVRGIANLHGPLAFNNSSFLYDAMLDSGWWKGRGFHVANGVFVFVIVLQAIISGARSVKGGPEASNVRIFRFLLLAPAIYIAQNGNLASYSTDVPANLIVLAASALLYEFLDDNAPHRSRDANAHILTSLSILFAAAVCIKMSSAVFAAVAMPIAVYLWWKRRDRTVGARPVAVVTLITLCFAIAWMTRGVLMSGYPLFPLSLAGLPVEWRAPIEHVQAEYAYIGFTEREFTWRFIGRQWLRQVFLNDIYSVFIPSCLTAVAVAASIFSRKIRSRLRETPRDTWWLLVPVLAAIAGWTLSAPSLRYGLALFWVLAAWSICECLRARTLIGTQARRQVTIGLMLLGVSPLLVAPALAAILHGDNVIVSVLRYNIIEPEADHWLPAVEQNPNVVEYTTRSGLGLNVPKKTQGDREFAKCWNAPLPCTPNPAPNLQLIEPGRLEKGFKVAGGWQMEDWPAYWQDQYLREWRSRRAGTRTTP